MDVFTTEQWIVIAAIFAAGLLVGLVLRSGGAKWRRKFEVERAEHATLRREYDAHLKRHAELRPAEQDTLRTGSF